MIAIASVTSFRCVKCGALHNAGEGQFLLSKLECAEVGETCQPAQDKRAELLANQLLADAISIEEATYSSVHVAEHLRQAAEALSQPVQLDREAVARIIEPAAFGEDWRMYYFDELQMNADQQRALAKADAIRALLTPQPETGT